MRNKLKKIRNPLVYVGVNSYKILKFLKPKAATSKSKHKTCFKIEQVDISIKNFRIQESSFGFNH